MGDLVSFQKLRRVVGLSYSAITSLREEEVHDGGLSSAPDDEDDISLPSDALERDRPGELVQETTSVDRQTGEGHTLGTHLEGKNLDWEESL